MYVTFFDDIKARHPRTLNLSWPTLANLVARPPVAPEKRAMRWIKLARFGEKRSPKGCARLDDNVVALSGIELDYDDPSVPMADACQRLAKFGVQAALHSTPSYWRNGSFRVLVPFREPAFTQLQAIRQEAVEQVADLIGAVPARESYTMSQAYYFGRLESESYLWGISSADGYWEMGGIDHDNPKHPNTLPPVLVGGPAYF